MENIKLGFLGLGLMGTTLASGIARSKLIKKENINFYNRQPVETEYNFMKSNVEVVNNSDIIICAVKPDVAPSVLEEVKSSLGDKLLISICAGITLGTLSKLAGTNRVVRVMPNIPCLVGEGAFTFCTGDQISLEHKEMVIRIFSTCGLIEEVKEKDMDITTSLFGSGPAYVFYFIESLIEAGVKNGLRRDMTKRLVLKTIAGAVKMAESSKEPIQQLKDNVCSPGGTTAEGLFALDKNGFKFAVIDAVDAACKKSKLMGQTSQLPK